MVTVAIANVLESSKQALEFIYQESVSNGLTIQCISPKERSIYMHNKRIPLKHYIEEVEKENGCDLLIIDLSKEAIEKQLYEHLDFHIALLFNNELGGKKQRNKRLHVTPHMIKGIKANYYIVPDKYKEKISQGITYGWSKAADISATSAQTMVDGQTALQCCIGHKLCTMKGQTVAIKEFGIETTCKSIDGLLAGVATLILYGIDLSQSKKS